MTGPTLARVLGASFDGKSLERARLLLDEFGRGPWGDAQGPTRIRFAVVKVAGGNVARLEEAIARAELDWRDVLVSAGFAESTEAHVAWAENMLGTRASEPD